MSEQVERLEAVLDQNIDRGYRPGFPSQYIYHCKMCHNPQWADSYENITHDERCPVDALQEAVDALREQEVGDSTETMGALRRLVSRLRSQGKIGGPEGGAFETLFLQAEAQLAASRKRVNETLTEYYRGTWPHYDSGYRCLECKQEWTDHRDDCVVPKVRRAALAEEGE